MIKKFFIVAILSLCSGLLGLGPLWLVADAAAHHPFTRSGDVITPTHRVYLPFIQKSPPSMLVSYAQGFDTCAAPTPAQLATWKQASYYEFIGIYLGGSMHYHRCKEHNEQYQTPAWLTEVRAQGWQFIPTWVGPQAPCSIFSDRVSYDPVTARSEGAIQAQQAISAGVALGLYSPLIIYYDMENYNVNDTDCHSATNAFLTGWVEEMHNQGHQAGIYGGVTAVNDWYTLEHIPDSTWVARYIYTNTNPFATVQELNEKYIDPAYWDEHRLFQYSGSHSESWDGVVLNVDNNVAAGLVALFDDFIVDNLLREMTLLSASSGWIWLNEQLYLTRSSGDRWRDITPAQVEAILGAHFLDDTHGWLAGFGPTTPLPALWRTTDGGENWQQLPAPPVFEQPVRAVYFDFITADTGWLLAEAGTGPNFSQGRLFTTNDGGQSWRELSAPTGGPMDFVTPDIGWLAGGPTNSELYRTLDGGRTWQPVSVAATRGDALPVYALPVFEDTSHGAIAVTVSDPAASRVEIYTTDNGGDTWQLGETVPVTATIGPGVHAPAQIIGPQRWLVGETSTGGLPPHTSELSFASAETGWAISRHNSCATDGCTRSVKMWRTTDGGQSWTALPLPQP